MLSFHLKHHPPKPFKLTKWTYVRQLSRHNCLRNFPIQFKDALWSFGPYIRLKFKAIILKSLWASRINDLPTGTFFQLLVVLSTFNHGVDCSVCHKWHNASLSFLLNLPRIIFCHCHILQLASLSAEREGTMPCGLHFPASLSMSMTNQKLWLKSVYTCCLS